MSLRAVFGGPLLVPRDHTPAVRLQPSAARTHYGRFLPRFAGQTAGQTSGFSPDIQESAASAVSAAFRKTVRQGTRLAFADLPQGLLKDLSENGYRILLADKLGDVIRFEDFHTPEMIDTAMADYRRGLMDEGLPVPEEKAVRQAVEAEWIAQMNTRPAVLDPVHTRVILAENPDAEAIDVWNGIKADPEKMARVVRHETGHFIDRVLGEKYSGGQFCHQKEFLGTLMLDLMNAADKDTLPNPEAAVEMNTSDYAYYFPLSLARAFENGKPNPEAFRDIQQPLEEAFAEVFAARTGGGACNPVWVQTLFPGALQVMEEQALNRYKPLNTFA